ncbi:MAG: hypothetical protein ACLU37_01160 [Collinsella sp.]
MVREHAKQRAASSTCSLYRHRHLLCGRRRRRGDRDACDLNTYLDWAERNMRQNGFVGPQHHFVRDDVLAWIRDQRQTRNRWD